MKIEIPEAALKVMDKVILEISNIIGAQHPGCNTDSMVCSDEFYKLSYEEKIRFLEGMLHVRQFFK